MALHDLHILPRVRDSWTYLYAERCKIDRDEKAIALHDEQGKTPVPCAMLSALMLGPGASITHAAIQTLADNGCLVLWTGEEGVRFYASGQGETRSSRNLIHQARLASDPALRLQVVRRMYLHRFDVHLDPNLTLQQIRGLEGVRVRDTYARFSRETGVPWRGRSYQRQDWGAADPINRALSAANSCLYGICHSAIVAAGYSPGLGFIHTGDMRSFVLDTADLYKTRVSIPVAFEVVGEGGSNLETRIRYRMRDFFKEHRVLPAIIADIAWVLKVTPESEVDSGGPDIDAEPGIPTGLWDPDAGVVASGVNYGEVEEERDGHHHPGEGSGESEG